MFKVWAECNTNELEKAKNVILPIGATEQHGKHLPVGTDTFLIDGLLELLKQKKIDDDFFILPTIPFGKSVEHLSFAGTINLSAHTLINLLDDIVFSLAQHNLKRIIIINGHGGNIGTIDSCLFDMVYKYQVEAYAFHLGLMFSLSGDEYCSLPYSMHAGYAETSVMKYLYPDRFSNLYANCPKTILSSSEYSFFNDISHITSVGWTTRKLSKEGFIGDPAIASGKKGELIVEKLVDVFLTEIKKIMHKEE